MKMLMSLAIAVTLAAPAVATSPAKEAPSTSIFGMQAGAPVPYPICESYVTKVICQKSMDIEGRPWDEFFIKFPLEEVPEVMSSLTMSVKTVGGNVVGFNFETIGFRGQERTIQLLSEKFGKPTSVVYQDMGTMAGGSFQAALATWEFSNLSVRFDSLGYGTKGGRVEIFTPEGAALKRQMEDAENKKRVPL